MATIFLDKVTQEQKDIFRSAFASYLGKLHRIEITEKVTIPGNYWDSGSKTYVCFVDLGTKKTVVIGDNHPQYNAANGFKAGETVDLPLNLAMVTHSIVMGKDRGLTLYIHPDNINPELLTAPSVELTREEKIVLYATRSLKSSYAGIPNYRLHEARRCTGITDRDFMDAKQQLIEKKLLDKRGAITPQGRTIAQTFGHSWPQ